MQRDHHQMPSLHSIRGFIAAVIVLAVPLVAAVPATAATLDRIKGAGKLTIGYRTDAAPFSFEQAPGRLDGYSIALCQKVADEVKSDLGLTNLVVEWVPVTVEDRFAAVGAGKIDLLCGAASATLARRKEVAFSIPIFPGGIAAMLRSDTPQVLRDVLESRPATGPIWRGSPAQVLTGKTFSVVDGTTGADWLWARLKDFQLAATVVPVADYGAGAQGLLDRKSDVFFGDRAILAEAAAANPSASDLIILDRVFTSEPIALSLAKNDDDFRLVVDRALSHFFASAEFRTLYAKWFGAPDDAAKTFFLQSALPD